MIKQGEGTPASIDIEIHILRNKQEELELYVITELQYCWSN